MKSALSNRQELMLVVVTLTLAIVVVFIALAVAGCQAPLRQIP
jgi:hypothetical protein